MSREEDDIRRNIGGFDNLSQDKKERMRISRLKKAERKKKKETLRKANNFDHILKECIKLFSEDKLDEGAEAVAEMAHIWKSGGQDINSFLDLMKYVEDQAIEISGAGELLRVRIREALKRQRNKTGVIIH